MGKTFEIINLGGLAGRSIKCLICNMTSYNTNDVEKEYCGNCNEFHNVLGARREQMTDTNTELTEWSRKLAHDIDIAMEDGMNEFGLSIAIEDHVRISLPVLQRIIDQEKQNSLSRNILDFLS